MKRRPVIVAVCCHHQPVPYQVNLQSDQYLQAVAKLAKRTRAVYLMLIGPTADVSAQELVKLFDAYQICAGYYHPPKLLVITGGTNHVQYIYDANRYIKDHGWLDHRMILVAERQDRRLLMMAARQLWDPRQPYRSRTFRPDQTRLPAMTSSQVLQLVLGRNLQTALGPDRHL